MKQKKRHNNNIVLNYLDESRTDGIKIGPNGRGIVGYMIDREQL